MLTRNHSLKDQLSRASEITISVTGRKTGRTISNPVWFFSEGDKLYLLPVRGSDTEWYKNVLKHPMIRIEAAGAETELQVAPIIEAKEVAAVVEKFRMKYGVSNVKKYYSKFDVAVVGQVS